jgi:hypothetical protein
MGIAGLLAKRENWRLFNEDWDSFLTVEKVPNPFHMTDFLHHSERFSDSRWKDRNERKRILLHLLAIIERAEVVPIGASVVLKDFNGLTEEQKKLCGNPYFLAFQAVTSNMGFAAAIIDLDEKKAVALRAMQENRELEDNEFNSKLADISMVYAKLRGFTGPAEELWKAIKRVNMFGAWMSSYAPGEPKDHPPLQAADIWAYSLGHHGEHGGPKYEEAQLALSFFVDRAMKQAHGAHWFTLLSREEILLRTGQLPYFGEI